MSEVTVTISVDTEEDNWGVFPETSVTTENVQHLRPLQEIFDRWGARPTYLVNRPPLMSAAAVAVLGELEANPSVEIGAQCHPWNTPPYAAGPTRESMMCALPGDLNREKIREISHRIERELGVRPRAFRAGRWGFGSTVAAALAEEGYLVDSSVTPFIDWTSYGGPDFSTAPRQPYRFHPDRPLIPDPTGPLLEIPTTIGFLRGDQVRAGRARTRLEQNLLARTRLVGMLDRLGFLKRRWLSPETSSGSEMIRLADAWVTSGARTMDLTFHSCSLLPGATPFVADDLARGRFLASIDLFLRSCAENGFRFATLSEVGEIVAGPAVIP